MHVRDDVIFVVFCFFEILAIVFYFFYCCVVCEFFDLRLDTTANIEMAVGNVDRMRPVRVSYLLDCTSLYAEYRRLFCTIVPSLWGNIQSSHL